VLITGEGKALTIGNPRGIRSDDNITTPFLDGETVAEMGGRRILVVVVVVGGGDDDDDDCFFTLEDLLEILVDEFSIQETGCKT
jgi:hypothetical protein